MRAHLTLTREELVAELGKHFLQRSCLGCSCGTVFPGRFDYDALTDWHLGHVADALLGHLRPKED